MRREGRSPSRTGGTGLGIKVGRRSSLTKSNQTVPSSSVLLLLMHNCLRSHIRVWWWRRLAAIVTRLLCVDFFNKNFVLISKSSRLTVFPLHYSSTPVESWRTNGWFAEILNSKIAFFARRRCILFLLLCLSGRPRKKKVPLLWNGRWCLRSYTFSWHFIIVALISLTYCQNNSLT